MRRRWPATAVLAAALFAAHGSAGALDECPGSDTACSEIAVGSASGAAGSTVTIPLTFTPGADDGVAESGTDDIAALALTLGVPGTSDQSPLTLADCGDADADGLPDAVQPNAALDDLRVVVENARCTNRNRCLCPGEGQTTDNFINLVVYGPKDLPTEGEVDIPEIPAGELLTIALRIGDDQEVDTVIPLHIFSETDDGAANPKPTSGAFFSQGDQSAVDRTADRDQDLSRVRVGNGTVTVEQGGVTCVGDCNGSGDVTVDELVRGVNIALGNINLDQCPAFDGNGDGEVAINELVAAVSNALNGCPS